MLLSGIFHLFHLFLGFNQTIDQSIDWISIAVYRSRSKYPLTLVAACLRTCDSKSKIDYFKNQLTLNFEVFQIFGIQHAIDMTPTGDGFC